MSTEGRAKLSVLIVVEAGCLARWVLNLADALAAGWSAAVSIRIVDSAPQDSALASLLALERIVLRGHRPVWTDRIDGSALAGRLETDGTPAPKVVIDLRHEPGGEWPARTLVLTPRFNGQCGETALASALFFASTPRIEIVARAGDADPRVAASGFASLEAAQGIGGAMEAVWSRVIPLIVKARGELSRKAPLADPSGREIQPISNRQLASYGAKAVSRAAARAAYRLCCHAPHWRVGWRRIAEGGDVWSRRDLAGARWNVLGDPGDHFYADPFPAFRDGRDWLFFEDLDHKTGKGIISVVGFGEDGRPGQVEPVLEEPWHLSYPFLIEEDGETYMVPEASLSGEIAIYRATDLPRGWVKEAVLVSGVEAADATIIRHDGSYWMFAVTRDGSGGYSDTLAIWHAPALFGPWTPHARNPVLVDDRAARPAGNMVVRDGQLWRPVQDCRNGYGAALGLARVTQLDPDRYDQQVETVLTPNADWPGRKLHTQNYNGRIEAIDGSVIRPKLGVLAGIVEARTKPAGQ
ncbi:MAG: hypothetical protein JJ913_09205 [Rhizobiaceae bacterium]|nr:hypothetical protein [Rhizobiaceae bacterium]